MKGTFIGKKTAGLLTALAMGLAMLFACPLTASAAIDGKGHTIAGLGGAHGLFGQNLGTITDLTLEEPQIETSEPGKITHENKACLCFHCK